MIHIEKIRTDLEPLQKSLPNLKLLPSIVTIQPAPFAKSYFVLIGNCVAIFAHNLALNT